MSGEPRVVEVGTDAAAGLMERQDLRAVVFEVGIKTVKGAGGVGQTSTRALPTAKYLDSSPGNPCFCAETSFELKIFTESSQSYRNIFGYCVLPRPIKNVRCTTVHKTEIRSLWAFVLFVCVAGSTPTASLAQTGLKKVNHINHRHAGESVLRQLFRRATLRLRQAVP